MYSATRHAYTQTNMNIRGNAAAAASALTSIVDLEAGRVSQYHHADDAKTYSMSSSMQCGGCKRKFQDAFADDTYDDNRYGQHIGGDFFKNNYGRNLSSGPTCVTQSTTTRNHTTSTLEKLEEGDVFNIENIKEIIDTNGNKIDVQEVLSWCANYLANKRLSLV